MGQTQQGTDEQFQVVLIITRICITEIQRTHVRTHLLPLKAFFFFFGNTEYSEQ